jgi:hypothetical protein
MAKEPTDLVVPILRNIQGTLADHGRVLEEFRGRFEQLERGQARMMDSVIAAIGLAGHADLWSERADNVEEKARSEGEIKLDELMAELEKLPPEELKRQMDAAAALLLKEQSCPIPP